MPKVKKKAPAKRTRKKSTRKKKTTQNILAHLMERFAGASAAGATVLAAIGAAILWAGGYFGLMGEQLSRLSGAGAVAAGMEVARITARGHEQTSEQEILSAIGPVMGASMFHFDPHAARARVEALGWVRSAAVSRLWPNTVHVSVREREPAAVWQMSGVLNLIDPMGAVIRPIDAFEYSNLPLIVGAGAPESASGMLKALRGDPALWGETAALIRVGDRRWNMRLKSGGDVKFPEEGYESAVALLADMNAAYGLLDREIEYIDLRDPNHVVFRVVGASEESLKSELSPR